jgi:hypothetical protein
MLFFVKVRIDVDRLDELDRRLRDGSLDRSPLQATYCYRDDPEVGLNLWRAQDAADLRRRFAPHRVYYRDVVEITPVVAPDEALALLRG